MPMDLTPVPPGDLTYILPVETGGDVDAEREHRKTMLAATFRLFAKMGFDEGVAGHVTARDPEYPELFWVNPFGKYFGDITKSDIICVDESGQVIEGKYPVNAAAFAIHSQIHANRPDVVAAAHTHSEYGRAFSTLGKKLDPLTQDACAFHGDHGLFDDYTGVVLEIQESKRIAAALEGHKACILRNHGLLTVGGSVEAAAWWYISMERSCKVQLLADAAGTPILVNDEQATKTAQQVGQEYVGRLSFQPLFQMIIREQPDLLD
ncbi:MAG: ribulose-5-phosphate 4-epimerase/fuculose-1-phosphate aldolase [Glaciecola sp.]|jgi:ribulose-5-phosphate 4-epimerase/fuculose-1-phosphate aldolase